MLSWFTWCYGVMLCIEMHSLRRPAPKIVADRATIPFPEALLTIFVVVLGIWDARRGWFGKRSYKLRSLKTLPPHPGLLIVLGGVGARRDLRRSAWCRWSIGEVCCWCWWRCFFVFWGMLDEAGRQMWIQRAIKQHQQVRRCLFQAKAYIFHEMILMVSAYQCEWCFFCRPANRFHKTPPQRSWLWGIHPSLFEVHWRGSGQLQTRWGAEDFLPPAPFQKVSWMLYLRMAFDLRIRWPRLEVSLYIKRFQTALSLIHPHSRCPSLLKPNLWGAIPSNNFSSCCLPGTVFLRMKCQHLGMPPRRKRWISFAPKGSSRWCASCRREEKGSISGDHETEIGSRYGKLQWLHYPLDCGKWMHIVVLVQVGFLIFCIKPPSLNKFLIHFHQQNIASLWILSSFFQATWRLKTHP